MSRERTGSPSSSSSAPDESDSVLVPTVSALAVDLEPLINSALQSGWVVCSKCFRSPNPLLKRRSQPGQLIDIERACSDAVIVTSLSTSVTTIPKL